MSVQWAEDGGDPEPSPVTSVTADTESGVGNTGDGTAAGDAATTTTAPTTATATASGDNRPEPEREEMTGREEVTGRELYITASYFNHSCRPNCYMDATASAVARGGRPPAVVRTVTPVASGSELSISYIDLDQPRCVRHVLWSAWPFIISSTIIIT